MQFDKVLCLGILAAQCVAQADTFSQVINPPFYTDVGRLDDGSPYFFHDDQWAAFVFLRLPSCVPADFNLLDQADFTPAFPGGPPRVFGCALTVDGHAIFKSPDDFVPIQTNLKGLGAVPDAQLYALARYLYSLQPPRNPIRPLVLTTQGARIFKREGCEGCHTPPLYTNNTLTPAAGFTPPPEHLTRYAITPVRVGTDSTLALRTRRGTGYHKVPSLKGVWFRGPFEHNGSVATLEDWFDPHAFGRTTFLRASREWASRPRGSGPRIRHQTVV